MALKAVKGTFERMLDKNLQDLVRGIRNHKDEEAKYIAECIEEIKAELKLDNLAAKANAINKLIYLQMLGNDIGWSAFNVIEVMSSTKFTYKRIGYLAASQSFHDQTDVLMLTTNLIRKDLNSPNYYETGVALTGLSCFLTTDLARDLANDIMTLMNSTKPYIRKKAVLLMYKVFLKFPDALRPAFPRLKEKLEDPDPGVQSAAVNVICELARKNPKNYLSLAPLFFKLMNSSNNNWVLIKIIKLFGALTPLEPRLGKKLIEPLTNLIHSTSAMSLLYECINTVIAGIPNHSASIQLCVQKLRILIEDSDQNLKYLGLLAMTKILKSHPKSVQAHKDLILNCLDDKDESIRLRALDLLYGMISRKNIMEIVKKLMTHMEKTEVAPHYRNELLNKIIQITSQDNYQYISNFEWYVTVLVELTQIEGVKNGELIANQILDVAIRVPTVREFTVRQMANLLFTCKNTPLNTKQSGLSEVIYAASWICGEYAEYLVDPEQTLDSMLHSSSNSLPGHIQSVLVQCSLKLYCHLAIKTLCKQEKDEDDEDDEEEKEDGKTDIGQELQHLTQSLLDKLALLVHSSDLEVQERAVSGHQLLRYVLKQLDHHSRNHTTTNPAQSDVLLDPVQNETAHPDNYDNDDETLAMISRQLAALFPGELNPVTSKAQRKVPIPDDLDLDAWINEPPVDPNSVSGDYDDDTSDDDGEEVSIASSTGKKKKKTKKELKKEKKTKKKKQSSKNLFGDLTGSSNSPKHSQQPELSEEQLEQLRLARVQEQESNPHYIKDTSNSKNAAESNSGYISLGAANDELPPVQPFENILSAEEKNELSKHSGSLQFPNSDYYLSQEKRREDAEKKKQKKKQKSKQKTKSKSSKKDGQEDEELENEDISVSRHQKHVVRIDYDLPEGADANEENDQGDTSMDANDPHRLLNIDLDKVLEEQKASLKQKTVISEKASKKTKKSNKKTDKKTVSKKKKVKYDDKEVEEKVEPTVPNSDPFSEWLQDEESKQKRNTPESSSDKLIKSKKSGSLLDKLEPIKIKSDAFSNLLSSGDLQAKSSANVKLNKSKLKFDKLVRFVCKSGNLYVIEEIDNSVSLYTSHQEDSGSTKSNVCLLLKMMVKKEFVSVKIEGKSENEDVLKKVVKLLKQSLTSKYPLDVESKS